MRILLFQMKKGDLLIQSDKIIGFLKNVDNSGGIIIFHRAVSIISTDRDKFNLETSSESLTSSIASRASKSCSISK